MTPVSKFVQLRLVCQGLWNRVLKPWLVGMCQSRAWNRRLGKLRATRSLFVAHDVISTYVYVQRPAVWGGLWACSSQSLAPAWPLWYMSPSLAPRSLGTHQHWWPGHRQRYLVAPTLQNSEFKQTQHRSVLGFIWESSGGTSNYLKDSGQTYKVTFSFQCLTSTTPVTTIACPTV